MKRVNWEYLWEALKEGYLLIKTNLFNLEKKITRKKKTLIIHTCGIGGIGDFFVCLPAIHEYIKRNKDTDLLVLPQVLEITKKIQGVGEVYTKDSKIKKEYDAVYIIRLNSWSSKMLKNIKYKGLQTSLYFIIKNNFKKPMKQWRDLTYNILGLSPVKKDNKKIFKFIENDFAGVKQIQEIKGKKVMIHTGSGWHVKLWSTERWIELIKRINKLGNFKFIFVGGDEEQKTFLEIQNKLNFKIYSLINGVNVKELLLAMTYCNAFIGVDSGPRNMANFIDLPSVGLPIVGQKIFIPQGKRHIILNSEDKNDSLFFFLGRETRLQKLQPETVLNAFRKIAF